ncbi:hypothetical protein A5666_11390 [Mycolicibacterium fortuitum]|uniref:hypothetical protein n=1 Tax=Mycolicibacterium fortuitum TaxID=1766 RepID=UPI0007EB8F95|nr:hypothetical protein [Mycolicibacterium fortuitum]OBA98018.1 hypothetical protein A5665_26325 [Mycolicibacterium fortuitum]OBI62445.1 hypothetical protein A5666_11390 [Mycolicibacterium fortuitum]
MKVTVRSPLTTGVALVGAGAIALTPISAVPAEIPVPAIQTAAVELTAAIDPLDAWVKLFTNTVTNATTLGQQIAADPAPILAQILENGAGHAQTVGTIVSGMGSGVVQWINDLPVFEDMVKVALENGQYDQAIMGAVMPLFMLAINTAMPLMSLSSITVGITGNLYNVAQTIANPMTLFGTVLGTLQIMSSTAGNLGIGVQSFADSVKAGDVENAIKALIATPALVLNGLVNGTVNTPGILTPESPTMSPLPGPIAGVMVQVRRAIAQALGAPAPTSTTALRAAPDVVAPDGPAALPSAAATAVAVNLTTETKTTVEAPAVEAAPTAATTGDIVTKAATDKVAGTQTAQTATVPGEATAATETATDATSTRVSAKAPSGKPAANVRGEIKKSVDSVGKKVNSTVSKIRDGLKKSVSKPAKPSKKADSGAGSSGSTKGSE